MSTFVIRKINELINTFDEHIYIKQKENQSLDCITESNSAYEFSSNAVCSTAPTTTQSTTENWSDKFSEADYSVSDMKTDVHSAHYSETMLFLEYGYRKDKLLCHTRKGEIFIANDLTRHAEPVCIKKISSKSIKDLQSESDVIGFFQSEQYSYFVTPLDFGANMEEFISQCHKYIKNGKLTLQCYRRKTREILWGLIVTIRHLHERNVVGLDICLENIFMRHSDFIQCRDGSIMINPMIGCRLIDFELCEMSQAETDEKEQRGMAAEDIYYFGNICYFCWIFEPPPTEYRMVQNLKAYLQMNTKIRYLGPTSLALLQLLLNPNPRYRLKTANRVTQQKYFRRFYKSEQNSENE